MAKDGSKLGGGKTAKNTGGSANASRPFSFKEGKPQDILNAAAEDIAKKIDDHNKRLGFEPLSWEKSDAREWVEDALNYFERKGINDILHEDEEDAEHSMRWKFSGHDRETGEWAQFSFTSGYTEKSAKDTLNFNGYSIHKGLVMPERVFDYLVDNTQMNDNDIRNAKTLASVLLRMKREKRKKG